MCLPSFGQPRPTTASVCACRLPAWESHMYVAVSSLKVLFQRPYCSLPQSADAGFSSLYPIRADRPFSCPSSLWLSRPRSFRGHKSTARARCETGAHRDLAAAWSCVKGASKQTTMSATLQAIAGGSNGSVAQVRFCRVNAGHGGARRNQRGCIVE